MKLYHSYSTKRWRVVEVIFIHFFRKPVKVIAPQGKYVVSSTASGEIGQTTTINTCKAAGKYVVPMMIFKKANEVRIVRP